MLFYRYSYFINQNDFEFYFKILLSLLVGSLILIFFVQYLRHRSDSKYRDLLIIFVLVGVLLGGIQYTRVEQLNTAHSQQAQMTQRKYRSNRFPSTPLHFNKIWSSKFISTTIKWFSTITLPVTN